MILSKSRIAGLTGILLAVSAGSAAAGSYGMYPQGMGMGYGPGGYGAPYPMPPMGPPPRPQRPMPPPRPRLGPYGYGGGMNNPYMRGGYGMQPQAAPDQPTTAEAAAPADNAAVSMSQMKFNSATVTIKTGGTVTWTNNDGMPHTVTANDGSFGSAQLGAGGTFAHTFDNPGTFSYYCMLHPTMRGTVVVVD